MNPVLLADAILVVHALIIVFIVAGLPLIWIGAWRRWNFVRRPAYRVTHLAAIAFVVGQTWLDQLCPLTVWEAQLRREAGQTHHDQQFIAHWLGELIFVDASLAVLAWVYTLFGLAVVLTLWWVPIRWRRSVAVG
jgi:hypothetical protein